MGDFIYSSLASLTRIQGWTTARSNAFPNPWTDPMWFFEDVWDLLVYALEDYLFCSPVFWYCWYILIAYGALRTALYLRRDYLHFLSLGRGGKASNIFGWVHNKWWQFLLLEIIGVDVFSKPFIHPLAEPYNGILFDLPQRTGPRPGIVGIGPLRQEDGGSARAMEWIMERFRELVEGDPDRLIIRPSFLTGLPSLAGDMQEAGPLDGTPNSVAEWGSELAHVRHDGSTGIRLHPSDAAEVIRLGWGQRNPLAVMDETWIWKVFHHWILRRRTPLPHNMVIVYSPRNNDDEAVFNQIMGAAIWANERRSETIQVDPFFRNYYI